MKYFCFLGEIYVLLYVFTLKDALIELKRYFHVIYFMERRKRIFLRNYFLSCEMSQIKSCTNMRDRNESNGGRKGNSLNYSQNSN